MTARPISLLPLLAGILLLSSCRESGQEAPEFELQDLSGRYVRLSQFQGRLLVLAFWSSSCGICRRELPVLDRIRLDYGNQGVAVLTVTPDGQEGATQFLNKSGLNLWTVLDPEFDVFTKYGVQGVPTTFLIDAGGRVVKRWSGMNRGAIERSLQQSGIQL